MPDEPQSPAQQITAGDKSQNYQAARDVNVHNHATPSAPQPLLVKPTNAQIAKYDRKTSDIIRAANRMAHFERLVMNFQPAPMFGPIRWLLLVATLFFLGWLFLDAARFVFDWLLRLF